MAGVLAHTPALLALTAPSVNSYRRLQPRSWSSAFVCWGPDNREATVRVPSTFMGAEEASTNLELKPADASANPYLAFGALVAAGLDGIRQKLDPPRPGYRSGRPVRSGTPGRGSGRYPQTLADALDALEADLVLRDALGEPLTRAYLAVRRSEVVAYAAHDDDFEFRQHFLKY